MFTDSKGKASTALSEYKDAFIFQDFFLEDDNLKSCNHKSLSPATCQADVLPITFKLGKKVKPTAKAKKAKTTVHCLRQKAKDIERAKQSYAGQNTKTIQDVSNAIDVV